MYDSVQQCAVIQKKIVTKNAKPWCIQYICVVTGLKAAAMAENRSEASYSSQAVSVVADHQKERAVDRGSRVLVVQKMPVAEQMATVNVPFLGQPAFASEKMTIRELVEPAAAAAVVVAGAS